MSDEVENHEINPTGPTAPALVAPARRHMIDRLGRKRVAVLALLALLLAGSVTIWAGYLTTRQPLTKMLTPAKAVLASSLQPRYLFSINDIGEPYGVAVTPEGDRIYVVEGLGHRLVRVFDRDGKELASIAPPETDETGRQPMYVAVDSQGLVYVTDKVRMAVDVYDSGGNYKTSIKSPFPAPQPWFPLGIQVDGNSLLVTEVTKGKHRVLRLSKDGQMLSEFGSEGQEAGQLAWPQALASDTKGRIFVSDGNNSRIQVFDRDGKLLRVIPDFSLPRGVEVDGYQRLHVVDTIAGQVSVFDASKDEIAPLFTFGDVGIGGGEFSYPNCIAIDDTDRLYISDRMNNRVQVWVY